MTTSAATLASSTVPADPPQSTFQVGGNTGSAIGPLLAAAIVIPHAIAWFMLAAALAVCVLLRVTGWSIRHGQTQLKRFAGQQVPGLSRGAMWRAVGVIALLMFAKFVYIAALVVYAQEAVPGRVGMVSGVMFGLMFGISGIGAAGLGELADRHGIEWVYQAISFLPLLGLATALLPATRSKARPATCC